MKRSEINSHFERTVRMLDSISFRLPRFAYWTYDEWQNAQIQTIRDTMRGWDITDFGTGRFDSVGAVLFTLRNGLPDGGGTPYAEKIICLKDGQRLPCHYHVTKTEDIINRGGGVMWIKLYNAAADGGIDESGEVAYRSDGIARTAKAGEVIRIETGNSITLTPYLHHTFGAEGDLVVGEVSSINDDKTDNYFAEKTERFAEIEEDEPPRAPLCNEYERLKNF